MREALAISKAFMAAGSAFQVTAAASIAGRERHGDGGTQVFADAAGLSRRDAHSRVKTARVIEEVLTVRDAVQEGRVSPANAKRLAEAAEKTSADAVESDAELLSKAQSMRPEQFAKEARRWAADRQDDGGEGDYRRLRAKRCVRIWDSDDGTVEMHGKFDPVAGRRIGNRLQAEARRMYDADKKSASDRGERRSFAQCMADAVDNLTSNSGAGKARSYADICVVAHLDEDSGKLVAETPEGQRLPEAVLEELACNAKFTGVLYDREGKPIWRARSCRAATDAQRQLLIARYGGCFHCQANPGLCQCHHIKPVSQGGTTSIENMVLVCWDCHNKIHHRGWQIHTSPDGTHTLHPPDRVTYGPARVPEEALLFSSKAFQPLPVPEPDTGPVHEPSSTAARDHLRAAETTPPPQSTQPRPPAPAGTGAPLIRPGPAMVRATLRTARAASHR